MKTEKKALMERKMRAFFASANPPRDLAALGWTPRALAEAGWTPRDLAEAGWTPRDLAALGWTPRDLAEAGWTPRDLAALGWTPRDLAEAGWTPRALAALGWTPRDLAEAGWTPRALAALGWTPRALAEAGWTPRDLAALGWTPRALAALGWTPRDLAALGWTPRALAEAQAWYDSIPTLEKPYSRMLKEIQAGQRKHDQSTFGPGCDPKTNLCGTPMCTAGHLVNMAGAIGYQLAKEFGFPTAAGILHRKARPDVPAQNFGGIPQAFAMAYIEERAAEEEAGIEGKVKS